ncbi:MAG: gliding motility protein GldN [Cytophagales bacterium]|nr:gliding motility protein GldN [Bernardetiaceae bacterium]MDW8204876.1 gliding motility protein GldN [Cytophagales bacterium]
MKKSLIGFVTLLIVVTITSAHAQEREEYGYNSNSLRPIRNSDQLFKKTLWWLIDLREKQNKPFLAKNTEITKVIIEAVTQGILRPFVNDSLKTRLSYDDFMKKITREAANDGLTEEEKALGFGVEDDAGGWGDEFSSDNSSASNLPDRYLPRDFYLIELKEDLIFDKKRSRMYHDIQAITIILPADKNTKGVDIPIASFMYKELVENAFKDHPDAIWFNNANPKEHRNFAEAFDLRLFAGHLVKYSNSEDASIEEIYGGQREAMYAALQIEYALLDFETQLWEY